MAISFVSNGLKFVPVDAHRTPFNEKNYPTRNIRKWPVEGTRGTTIGIGTGLARAWDVMTPATQAQVLQTIRNVASNHRALSSVDECVSMVSKAGATKVVVGLAAVKITVVCHQSLSYWYKGKIIGKRCAKSCVDSIVEIGAGVGGGVVGASIGSRVMPVVGTFIAGMFGGFIAGAAAKILVESLTTMIFDLPQENTLENSPRYNELGMQSSRSRRFLVGADLPNSN